MRWQRVARVGLGVFAVALAVVIGRSLRQRDAPVVAAPSGRTDVEAVSESTGAEITQLKGTTQDFGLAYERRRSYEDGRTRLDGHVTVKVRGRAGRDFDLAGDEADISSGQSRVEMRGHVVMATNSGLVVRTEQAVYDSSDGITRIPGPLTFASGTSTGEAVGATYDQNRDVLWLLDRVVMKLADEEAGAVDVVAGTAGYARRDHYLRFERRVRMTRGVETMEGDAATVYLADEGGKLELLELRGASSMAMVEAPEGGVERLESTDMNLNYRGDRTLERATLVGNGRVVTKASKVVGGRALTAQFIDVELSADGRTPLGLAARDAVDLDFSEPGQPARRVRAKTMDGRGQEGQGITSAEFNGDVDFRESRPAARGVSAIERVVRARTLDAGLGPGFGALQRARFLGAVTLADGPLRGSSAEAQYDVSGGTVELLTTGNGARSRVVDEGATVDAARINIGLASHDLKAETDVRSVLKIEAGSSAKRPGMLDGGSPVNVTGDSLVYDKQMGKATYIGNARLWQAETFVLSDVIVLDDRSGNLAATGKVRSVLMLEETAKPGATPQRRASTASAQDFLYEEARRVATYTTDARVVGPQGDVTADRIELYLDERGKALEKAEAYDRVLLKADARWATGLRLTFFEADARYVMGGTPVRILEQVDAECRETTGKTLTFYRSVDTISVDGKQETRTQIRSGGKCPEPRQ